MKKISLMTIGMIADEAGVKLHRVQHIIKSRRIRSIARAGRYHLYGPAQIDAVLAALGHKPHSSSRNNI